ncbi:MAG: hypothetical protein FWH26_07130 [Oscillospiraceae bacterium]|nr:hypothetical protein [Oscillospiraceae bacterium]
MAKKKLTAEEKFALERKKWQQQEAKRRSKKKTKVDTTSLAAKAIAVVLAVAVLAGLGAIFLKPELTGLPARVMPAYKVGSQTVFGPEWAFYYYETYYNQAYMADQYSQMYGQNILGLDVTMSPFGQSSPYKRPGAEEGAEDEYYDWEIYLANITNAALKTELALYQEAKKAKVALSEEAAKEIDEGMESLRTTASSNNLGLSVFLRLNYTPGITQRSYRKIQERRAIVEAFEERKREEFRTAYTDEMLQAEYDEDPSAYNMLDLRYYYFTKELLSPEEDESEEALQKRQEEADARVKSTADQFLAAVSDEASFLKAAGEAVDKEALPDYDAESATALNRYRKEENKLSEWAFDAARKAGDKAVIDDEGYFYAVLMTKEQYVLNTVDYYFLPMQHEADAEGAVSDEAKQKTLADTEALLAEYEALGSSAEAFDQLYREQVVAQHTEHEGHEEHEFDELSALLEKASPNENVAVVESWIFSGDRKEGDIEIIEFPAGDSTPGGYALVLFGKNNAEDLIWKNELADSHVSEDYDSYTEELTKEYATVPHGWGLQAARKTAERMILSYIESKNAQTDISF